MGSINRYIFYGDELSIFLINRYLTERPRCAILVLTRYTHPPEENTNGKCKRQAA